MRLPAWIENGPDGKPYRPWAAIWVSLRTGLMNLKMEPQFGSHDETLALDALLGFALDRRLAGGRPDRLEVADEALGASLVRMLGDERLAFTVTKDLRAVKKVLADYGRYTSGVPPPPGPLDAQNVTAERMRGFAEAAARFYLAAPWRYLTNEDLVHVEAPSVERGLSYFTVLGAGGQAFGLGFYETPEAFETLLADPDPGSSLESQRRWSVLFGPIQDMPFGDVDLWEDHGLPAAGNHAYPVAMQSGPRGRIRRPDATVLAYLQGLLLALAETSEGEIDQGRWSRQVQTHDGPMTFTLSIPALLEPLESPPTARRRGRPDQRVMERVLGEVERFMARSELQDVEEENEAVQARFSGPTDKIPSTATTPLEKAQDLVYRAFGAPGRRRTHLARKALEISPDCADAYVVLAEQAGDPETARALYAQGVAAGERALGHRTFEEDAGHFWGIVQTRPYMRARFGLAQSLEGLGRVDEAIGHYQELLRLNPRDNQGVRYILLPALLSTGRDDEAGSLLERFADDISAAWKYGWALWTFRREGDCQLARERLGEAVRANPHVPKYLTGKSEWPGLLPESYALGSEAEAAICAEELGAAWETTPGAERWLAAWEPKKGSRPRGHR